MEPDSSTDVIGDKLEAEEEPVREKRDSSRKDASEANSSRGHGGVMDDTNDSLETTSSFEDAIETGDFFDEDEDEDDETPMQSDDEERTSGMNFVKTEPEDPRAKFNRPKGREFSALIRAASERAMKANADPSQSTG